MQLSVPALLPVHSEQASLVGLTVHAQFFEQLDGHSNAGVPFAASMVVGFTDQP
jgi:hypothetical protein